MKGRDFIVYSAFSVLPAASFLLLGYPDASFFVALLVFSLVVVALMLQMRKGEGGMLLQFDADLDVKALLAIAMGVFGCFMVARVLSPAEVKTSLYVPMANMQLTIGDFVLPKFWSDLLFQFTLVAPAEESSKLVTQLALFDRLKGAFGLGAARIVSITVPVLMWALLHTYRNPAYMGQYMIIMVATAFVAGIIMYAVMWYTKSVLASILVHACFNGLVIYLTTYMG